MCKQQDMFGHICLDSLNKTHYTSASQVLPVNFVKKNTLLRVLGNVYKLSTTPEFLGSIKIFNFKNVD